MLGRDGHASIIPEPSSGRDGGRGLRRESRRPRPRSGRRRDEGLADPAPLSAGLHRAPMVVRPHPGHGVGGRHTAQDREHRQRRSGAADAAAAGDLRPVPSPLVRAPRGERPERPRWSPAVGSRASAPSGRASPRCAGRGPPGRRRTRDRSCPRTTCAARALGRGGRRGTRRSRHPRPSCPCHQAIAARHGLDGSAARAAGSAEGSTLASLGGRPFIGAASGPPVLAAEHTVTGAIGRLRFRPGGHGDPDGGARHRRGLRWQRGQK